MKSTIRKVIGIMPLYDDEKESYWMLPGYMKMLEAQMRRNLIIFSKYVVDFC